MPKVPKKLKGGSEVLHEFKVRNYPVVKRNDLIQNTRYSLTTNEQKIILHLIQQINSDTRNLTFTFNVKEYARFMGLKENRFNVHKIKQDLKRLADKSFWLKKSHNRETLVRWFSQVEVNHNTNTFTVRFDDRLKPFLLKTKQFFTQYNYYYIMTMQSSYSIRLYELFVSYYSMQNSRKGFNYSLGELREALDLRNKYPQFANFKARVLRPAKREINELTDMNIRIRPYKHGRKVVGVNVLLHKKSRRQLYQTENKVQERLESHKNG
ncbi:MAG: RepB family plasmid replication initiator protein [Acetilactobacillus jinshanensis]